MNKTNQVGTGLNPPVRLVDRKLFFHLRRLDLSPLCEEKNGITYLPWGECEALLRAACPDLFFESEVIDNGESLVETKLRYTPTEEEIVFWKSHGGDIVQRKGRYETKVLIRKGHTFTVRVRLVNSITQAHSQWYELAVTSNTQDVLCDPTANEIQNAIQRAFVKAVARETGIGHILYESGNYRDHGYKGNMARLLKQVVEIEGELAATTTKVATTNQPSASAQAA